MPNFNAPFKLKTDTLDFDYGTILLQKGPNTHWHPVAYLPKQMLPMECNYVIYDKELLTIIHAFKIWCHYLKGSTHLIEIWSDHKNLEHFKTSQSLNCAKPIGVYFYITSISPPLIAPAPSIKPIGLPRGQIMKRG
jgi:RNase H-like domain found in reverse transcriptase